ncbi:fimbrial protein [Escherichia coli]|uniref:fimbrial protein n=1 Tax=Escherichia coli TaxID=562 RepID=UPI00191899A1|nr:fimbrial protein [Escherichia coli]CAD5569040.1 Uncharacterised protein [Escherichia coli]
MNIIHKSIKRVIVAFITYFLVIDTYGVNFPGGYYVNGTTYSVNSSVDIDIPEPACNITVPANVDLGVLKSGINTVSPFDINVICPNPSSQYSIYMMTKNSINTNKDALYLKWDHDNSDSDITLHIQGLNDGLFTTDELNPVFIHKGTGNQMYTTNINVNVPNDNNKMGKVNASVIFKLSYA